MVQSFQRSFAKIRSTEITGFREFAPSGERVNLPKISPEAVGFYKRSTLDSRLVWWIEGPAMRRALRRRRESMHLTTGIRVVPGSLPYSYIPGTLDLRIEQ